MTASAAFFRMIAKSLTTADGASSQTTEAREGRSARLTTITFEEAVKDQCLIGSPEEVAERLSAIREDIPYSSLAGWMNPGGRARTSACSRACVSSPSA